MKKFVYQFAFAALVSGLFLTFNYNIAAQTDARALRGDDAVNQLKQTGRYDSLMSAVKAVRQADGQSDETPDAPDAVGQTTQLTANGGGLRDQFGSSVALSGSTAIVGAPYNDPNGIADQGTAYIFVSDGTSWTLQARLNGSNAGANDYFGNSVGISGDTVIVAARHNKVGTNAAQGAVYIFTRSNSIWTQQARIFAADGAGNDDFGESVGIDGDTAVVGAAQAAVGGNGFQGAAYVYTRTGGVWSQQAKLTSSDGASFDAYGTSVAISGNNVIVGAYLATVNGRAYQGAAYIYARIGIAWNQQAKLVAADGAAGDRLGYSVGISGNTAIAGAFQSKVGANNYQGSAYIFVGTSGVWAQQAKLIASDGAASDAFGFSVAVEGNTAVVGSLDDQVGTNFNQGSAYIFAYDITLNIWKQQSKLTAADGAANDDFGSSVAINGGNIIVGSYNDTVGGSYARGSAYVFRNLSNNWTQNTKSADPFGTANDQFGNSVAVSGDTAVVGSSQSAVSNAAQGIAWVFVRNGASWTLFQSLSDVNGAAGDNFGSSVAISGDTIIIGANSDDVGANTDQGSAYIFTRNNGFWSQQAQLTASGGAANDRFGSSVAVNGDTVVVGASLNDVGGNADQGSAYVFTRSGTNWTQQAQLNGTNGAANDRFGASVGISGDTAVVGAVRNTVGVNANQGSAYVFIRNGTTWTQQQRLTAADGAANDNFGYSVAINGDTVIVGAYLDDVGANADQGSAYIFVRTGAIWTQQAQLNGAGGAAGDSFGYSVGIDGDSAIVGAAFDDVGANTDQGSAFIFERTGTTWTQKQQLIDSGGAANDQFGTSVSVSGDKVIVGAPFSDASALNPFGANEKSLAPTAADVGAAIFFVNAPLSPTAAVVSISGRVITPQNLGLTNALVTLTDSHGVSKTVITGKFGGFIFRDVAAGETYILSVSSKHYTYAPQIVSPTENLSDITFTAQ